MDGFETVRENCPECGTKIRITEIPDQFDKLTKRPKRVLSCPKCGWKAII